MQEKGQHDQLCYRYHLCEHIINSMHANILAWLNNGFNLPLGEEISSKTVKVAEIAAFLNTQNFSQCLTKFYHSLGLSKTNGITVEESVLRT